MQIDIKFVKLVVTVPLSHTDIVRKAVGDTLKAGKFEKYSHCSFSSLGTGRYIPLDNAKPFIGVNNNFEEVEEERVEFDSIKIEDIKEVVAAMLAVHPYEQVVYDVYPLIDLSDIIQISMDSFVYSDNSFDKWNLKKKKIQEEDKNLYFREGDIQWCHLGLNIGSESFGKGENFRRPILVYKKLSNDLFVGIPLSTKNKSGTWFVEINFQNSKRTMLLYQIRTLNKKRLYLKIGEIDEVDYFKTKEKLEILLQPSFKASPMISQRIDGKIPKSK